MFWSFAGAQQQRRRDLPNEHRFSAYIALKALSINGQILLKDKVHVANLLDTTVRTVERIWKLAHEQIAQDLPLDLSNKKKGRAGRKRADLDLSRIATIPLNRRRTVRALARAMSVSCTTLHRRFQWGDIKRCTSTLKPTLKAENRISRLKFCISMLDEETLGNARPTLKI